MGCQTRVAQALSSCTRAGSVFLLKAPNSTSSNLPVHLPLYHYETIDANFQLLEISTMSSSFVMDSNKRKTNIARNNLFFLSCQYSSYLTMFPQFQPYFSSFGLHTI